MSILPIRLQAVDQDSLNYSIIYSILEGLRVQIYYNIHKAQKETSYYTHSHCLRLLCGFLWIRTQILPFA